MTNRDLSVRTGSPLSPANDTHLVNIWETIAHRWVIRDAFTAKIPAGETYGGYASKEEAVSAARRHGWQFSVFESAS